MVRSMFIRDPLEEIDGIPIFSKNDNYILNYCQMADDHFDHEEQVGHSPFMTGDQILDSEKVTLDFVERHLPASASILDAGVGTGAMLSKVPQYDRFGIDIALPYLKKARQAGITVAMSKLVDMPFYDTVFDAVSACDVLEHLLDLDASVTQLVRVLKPGGLLFVRVPNAEDLSSYVTDQQYKYAHVRSFTVDSLRLYMEKCFGLEFLEHGYCAKSFYAASQLINPAVPVDAAVRSVLPELLNEAILSEGEYCDALRTLGKGFSLTYEEQVDALVLLRDNHPEFMGLAHYFVRPAELVGVFRKPAALSSEVS